MRKLLVGVITAALLLLTVSPALAHVTVNPSEASKGGYAKLSFRVPNESDTAGTVGLQVVLPENANFRSVSVRPVPGWTYKVTEADITWTGGRIAPGEFQEFDVSFGPLPEDVDSLTFKALQTYEDGEIVRWIDETPASGEEPEHPAPVLTLTDATDDHGAAATEDESSDDDDANSGAAIGLSIAALVVALASGALALGSRRKSSEAAS